MAPCGGSATPCGGRSGRTIREPCGTRTRPLQAGGCRIGFPFQQRGQCRRVAEGSSTQSAGGFSRPSSKFRVSSRSGPSREVGGSNEHKTIQTTSKPRGSSAEASPSRGSLWRSNSHHSAAVGSGLRHLLRRWPGALHPAGLTQPTTGCRAGSFRDPKVLSGPSRLAAVWSTRSGPGLSRSDSCVPLRRARCRPSPRPKPSSRQTPWRTALRRFPADAPARSSGPARGAEAPRASAKVRPPPGYVNRNRCLVFAW